MKIKVLCLMSLKIILVCSYSNSSNLVQSACEVINKVIEKDPWMKTIALLELRNSFETGLTDDLLQCLPINISTILMNLKSGTNLNQKKVIDLNRIQNHNPSFAVVLVDSDLRDIERQIFRHMVLDMFNVPLLNHNNKFLFIVSSTRGILMLKKLLDFVPIVNFAILLEVEGKVYVEVNRQFRPSIEFNKIGGDLIDSIYLDYIKTQRDHSHVIFVYNQVPRIQVNEFDMKGKLFRFLEIVEKVEKSTMLFLSTKTSTPMTDQIKHILDDLTNSRGYEMTLNTLVVPVIATPKLLTYEQTGYCPLVPIPERISFSSVLFFKPFDVATWCLIVLSVISCMITWRMANNDVSMWYIPFFFWAFYHGQSVNFATKRKNLVILLQILIFATFILGNAFQGLITSFMIEKIETPRLSTFDELIESNYKVFVGNHFDKLMATNSRYQEAVTEGRISNTGSTKVLNFTQLFSENYAVLLNCDDANYYVENGNASNFYVINENIFARYDQLQSIYLSKYLKGWQLLMDWSFEAGLPQAWKTFERHEKIFKEEAEEIEILRLSDMLFVFYVLLVGCVIGVGSLFCEIFYHDFIQPYLERRKNLKLMKKPINTGRRKLNFRIRPIELN